VVVGDPRVGKTSLASKFIHGKMVPDEITSTYIKEMELNKKYEIHIVDITPKDTLKQISESEIMGIGGIMIVYDITSKESYLNVIGWFNDVVNYLPQCSVVLVGNKKDLTRAVMTSKAQIFAEKNHIPLFEVSAQTGENVEQAFRNLIETPSIPRKEAPTSSLLFEKNDTLSLSHSFYSFEGLPKHLKYTNEDVSSLGWKQHKKHFFILSDAGKPIFSRYGKEDNLSPMMGLLTAIVSFLHGDQDDIRTIYAGDHKTVFLVKGPLYFIAVSCTSEPESELVTQLELLYSQILFILTEKVVTLLKKKSSLDLRGLLGGTDNVLHSLIYQMSRGLSLTLSSTRTLTVPKQLRNQIGEILLKNVNDKTVYSIIVSNNHIVQLIKNKKYAIHSQDILLLLNFVNSSQSMKSSETWTPVCLPRYDPNGYFYAYISYFHGNVCLIMLNSSADNFFECSKAKNLIYSQLKESKCLDGILYQLKNPFVDVKRDLGLDDVRHFAYKSSINYQFITSLYVAPYNTKMEKKRLIRLYKTVRDRLNVSTLTQGNQKQYFLVNEKETIFVSVSTTEEMYVTFPLTTTKMSAMDACDFIRKWILREEDNLFIQNQINF
jgi:small GTP-binding protein